MKNYLIYPCKTMNITQGYSGSYSHASHINGTPKDYPIDEAGADSSREYFYCPCDEIKIAYIYGVGKGGTNAIWLESTSKVVMPYGIDYVTILVTHPNDDDLSKLKVGQKFTRGQAMFREGTDGNATGNHFHIAVGTGKYGDGWVKNTSGAWVMKTTGTQLKPEQAFYIDESFTSIKNNNGLIFKNIPKNIYRVQTGAFSIKQNAYNFAKELKDKGFDTYVVYVEPYYKVQVGAFSVRENAVNMKTRLSECGYDGFII